MDNINNVENDYKFSVLIPVYYKENPLFFTQALNSILDQTLQPNEIVIIEDGKLTKELYEVVQEFHKKYSKLKVIHLEKNMGLGNALKIGVENCSYSIIARMDSDDIANRERFEKQINYLKLHQKLDLVGSWISEFEDNENEIIAYRVLPTEHNDIYKFGQFRCPVNHMTVMYRKESVLAAGNYMPFKNIEDYYLWGRMLKNGAIFANIPEYLVNARAGSSMLQRRANLTYFFNSEFPLQCEFLKIGFINLGQFIRNIILKFLLRILPFKLMQLFYMKFLRKN